MISNKQANSTGSISASGSASGFGSHDTVVTFANWGDGMGSHFVGIGASINQSHSAANYTPGVHSATVTCVEVESGDSVSKSFNVHINGTVLLIDSNNDDGMAVPTLTNTPADEQKIANDPTKPGKIIQVDDNDLNGDGVPDFASGFGNFNAPTAPQGGGFVPITVVLPEWMDSAHVSLAFTYSASDPAGVTTSGAGTASDPFVYHPAAGNLRIWLKDQPTTRNPATPANGGDWVKSGEAFDGSKLTWSAKLATLWVEAVDTFGFSQDPTISLTLTATAGTFNGKTASTSVRVSVVGFKAAFDGNRDGAISFDGRDGTSSQQPYRFWINDNRDGWEESSDFNGFGNMFNPSSTALVQNGLPLVAGKSDSSNTQIDGTRDLEDFAPLQVRLEGPPKYDTVSLQIVPTGSSPTPSIRIWNNIFNGTSYLSSASDALSLEQSDNEHANDTIVLGSTPVALKVVSGIDPLEQRFTQYGANLSMIFEGISVGDGSLVLTYMRDGHVIGTTRAFLSLKSASDMFEHFSADPADNADAQHRYGNFQYTSSSPETDNYVLYVHGWNMSQPDKRNFSETAYKRLFWQGYKGRFGFFSWPTLTTPDDNRFEAVGRAAVSKAFRQNYDASELTAWNSASTLLSVLTSLNTSYPGHVNMFAHSMGNVVASEALRLESISANPMKIVNTYIATQAATVAGAYNGSYPRTLDAKGTPDLFGDYAGPNVGLFKRINTSANKLVNFYNPLDFAFSDNVWVRNQGMKPDLDYDYDPPTSPFVEGIIIVPPAGNSSRYYFYTEVRPPVRAVYLNPDNLSDLYKIFAFGDPAETVALGRAPNIGGPFSAQVNLNTTLGFGAHHWQHSGEFESTSDNSWGYWNKLLQSFGLI